MDSHSSATGGHLDASGDREVVFCHACQNEWYRSAPSLDCPRCESDITEVVDPNEDPRDFSRPGPAWGSSASTSPEVPARHFNDDSDPDEADIEEELHGPRGFFFRHNVARGPDAQHHDPHSDHDHDAQHPHVHRHHHHHDTNIDPVFQRFTDMIRGFGPPGAAGPGENGGRPRVQTTTFTHSNGTVNATVTMFTSGPMGTAASGGDPFQEMFNSTMREMDPPNHPASNSPNVAHSLQDLLSLILAPGAFNGRVGDAVYSQEALDEIISNLMEQNPQAHGAPPASQSALENLERKPVTKDLLEGEEKSDCTICLDDVKVGDQACFLPCKHWFHEACVTAWLRAHNTCPVCRTPIESPSERRAASSNSNNNNNRNAEDRSTNQEPAPPGAYPEGEAPDPEEADPSTLRLPQASRPPHPPFETRPRLNPPVPPQHDVSHIIRAVSDYQQSVLRARASQQHPPFLGPRNSSTRNPDVPPRPETTSPAPDPYDTSNLQRRTSHSPTQSRAYIPGESLRQRSPSRRGVERSQSSQSAQSSGRQDRNQGALEWLRNRFAGRGNERDQNDDQQRG